MKTHSFKSIALNALLVIGIVPMFVVFGPVVFVIYLGFPFVTLFMLLLNAVGLDEVHPNDVRNARRVFLFLHLPLLVGISGWIIWSWLN